MLFVFVLLSSCRTRSLCILQNCQKSMHLNLSFENLKSFILSRNSWSWHVFCSIESNLHQFLCFLLYYLLHCYVTDSMLLCGTPIYCFFRHERISLICTLKFLSFKKLSIIIDILLFSLSLCCISM